MSGRAARALVASVALAGLADVPSCSSSRTTPAEARYWDALGKLADQPHVTIRETLTDTLHYRPPAHGPWGVPGTRIQDDYVLRHAPKGTSVFSSVTGGYPPHLPLSIVLSGGTFCIGPDFRNDPRDPGWVCSPAHRTSTAWYVNAYLLGGWVQPTSYSESLGSATIGGHIQEVRFVRVIGHGFLGCTPAGAGARTKQGYRWCTVADRRGDAPVSAVVTIGRRSGLPLRFTAHVSGSTDVGHRSQQERVSFAYHQPVRVDLPRAYRKAPCMSWVPAIHCIELGARKGARG